MGYGNGDMEDSAYDSSCCLEIPKISIPRDVSSLPEVYVNRPDELDLSYDPDLKSRIESALAEGEWDISFFDQDEVLARAVKVSSADPSSFDVAYKVLFMAFCGLTVSEIENTYGSLPQSDIRQILHHAGIEKSLHGIYSRRREHEIKKYRAIFDPQ